MIDDIGADHYLTLTNDGGIIQGWRQGWDYFNANKTPQLTLDVIPVPGKPIGNLYDFGPAELEKLWPDTKDYDQNTPGIVEAAKDIDRRMYRQGLEKAFWLNLRRVPFCVSYLTACAKVAPDSILELGTGGDSAHSTGMFLYYLQGEGHLVSVDRHPLSRAWPRYRAPNWTFIQGDSVNVLHAMVRGIICSRFWDMIFIDSSHTYEHTLAEIQQCCQMTNAMLFDDTTDPGVDQALKEWHPKNPEWLRMDISPTVALLERHPYV